MTPPAKDQLSHQGNDVREDFQTLIEDVASSVHDYCKKRPQMASQGNVSHSILGHELEVNSRNDRHTSGALQLSARDTPNESMGAFLPVAT